MANQIVLDSRLFVDVTDLSLHWSALELVSLTEPQENTTGGGALGRRARSYLPGLDSFTMNHQGYTSPDGSKGPDDVFWSGKRNIERFVQTLGNGAAGDIAWSGSRLTAEFTLSDEVGQVAAFTFNGQGDGTLVRGQVLASPNTAVTGDVNLAGVQFPGGAAAGETLYGQLHVVEYTGFTDLDINIRSDDNPGFTTPSGVMSFPIVTGPVSSQATAAGPNTDDWYRVEIDTTGSGSALLIVTLGIQ